MGCRYIFIKHVRDACKTCSCCVFEIEGEEPSIRCSKCGSVTPFDRKKESRGYFTTEGCPEGTMKLVPHED